MIAYLIEVEERRLHLEAACSSLYDFCVRKLGLSENTAFRRVAMARLAQRFPSVLGRIERGELSISALLLLRDHLTAENHETLFDEATGLSKRTLEQLLATRCPKPDVPDAIWREAARSNDPDATRPVSKIEPLAADRYRVQLTASAELCAKIEHATELMRHQNPRGELAVLFERALDLLISDLEKKQLGKTVRPKMPKTPEAGTSSANVSRATRRAVNERDDGRCTFVSKSGERCSARGFLQLDHVHPRALDGTGDPVNIRLLCGAHNRLAAEKVFGRTHIERQIRLRRERRKEVGAKAEASHAASKTVHDEAAIQDEPAVCDEATEPVLNAGPDEASDESRVPDRSDETS